MNSINLLNCKENFHYLLFSFGPCQENVSSDEWDGRTHIKFSDISRNWTNRKKNSITFNSFFTILQFCARHFDLTNKLYWGLFCELFYRYLEDLRVVRSLPNHSIIQRFKFQSELAFFGFLRVFGKFAVTIQSK